MLPAVITVISFSQFSPYDCWFCFLAQPTLVVALLCSLFRPSVRPRNISAPVYRRNFRFSPDDSFSALDVQATKKTYYN